MGIGKRALLFLLRKKSKSVILLVILTVIATLVLICISIGSASDIAAQNLRETMGGYFKIETNLERETIQPVDDALVQKVMDSGGIKAYNGLSISYMLTDGLELVPGRFTAEGDYKAHLARFLSNTDTSLNEYFVLRSLSLKEGRHITPGDKNKALISDVLAQQNGLTIGDKFSSAIDSTDFPDEQKNAVKSITYEIVGIYQIDSSQNTGSGNTAECDIGENFIFTDTNSMRDTMGAVRGRDITSYANGATFYVEDPQQLDSIVSELPNISGYNWDGLTITKNNKTYDNSAAPLERMSGLTTVIMIVIIIISIILLSLVLIMWMRDRLHEIGILLSIGIKKAGIIAQHILENVIIAAFAFLIAWGIAGVAADQIGGIFLTSVSEQTERVQESNNQFQLYSDPIEVQKIESAELVNVQVGGIEFLEIVGIGFLIVIVSTSFSSILVIRMKPKDILSSMS